MNRSDFFKRAAAVAATPVLLKDLIDIENDKVIVSEPGRKKIAIDVHALQGIGNKGGREMTPKEILDLYFSTGILLYRSERPDGSEMTYNPIQIIE